MRPVSESGLTVDGNVGVIRRAIARAYVWSGRGTRDFYVVWSGFKQARISFSVQVRAFLSDSHGPFVRLQTQLPLVRGRGKGRWPFIRNALLLILGDVAIEDDPSVWTVVAAY